MWEFTTGNPAMPSEFDLIQAIARIDSDWESFRRFLAKALAPSFSDAADMARYAAFAVSTADVAGTSEEVDVRFKSHVLCFIRNNNRTFSPTKRLADALRNAAEPGSRPTERTACESEHDGSYVVELTLEATFYHPLYALPANATDHVSPFRGFGFSATHGAEAHARAREGACYAMLNAVARLLHPKHLSQLAITAQGRSADTTSVAAVASATAPGGILVGGQANWTRYTNEMSSMLSHLPAECPFRSSIADFVLSNGRSLELQANASITPDTIARRRRDHAAEGAGDPIWWLLASKFLCATSDLRSPSGAPNPNATYIVCARAAPDLIQGRAEFDDVPPHDVNSIAKF